MHQLTTFANVQWHGLLLLGPSRGATRRRPGGTRESSRRCRERSGRLAFVHLLRVKELGWQGHALGIQLLDKFWPHAGRFEPTLDLPILIKPRLLEEEQLL